MTPFQRKFGNYRGLFTYAGNMLEEDKEYYRYYTGSDREFFSLRKDDGTDSPLFLWGDKPMQSVYISLHHIDRLKFNTRAELDMFRMVHPDLLEYLTDYYGDLI